MNFAQAVAFLDDHMNLEAMVAGERATPPTFARITELLAALGDPQRQYPVIHLTGTNGKTSTGRLLGALLGAQQMSVGGYSSPHLEHVTERMTWNGAPISERAFADLMTTLSLLEPMLSERATWFELVTAAAFAWFADLAVDAAVVEVGLGGTWDATNAADGAVAVITNVGLDHQEFLGDTVEAIAAEKAGIIKQGATVVVGDADAPLGVITHAAEKAGADALLVRGTEFDVVANDIAVGGRVFSLRSPHATYEDVFLALHGAHQVDNAACAIVAAEAFFDRPLGDAVIAEACATVTSPGRLEVVSRHPVVLIDGSKNVAGAAAARVTVEAEFGPLRPRVLVVGMLAGKGKEATELVKALGGADADVVIACPAPSPRTVPAADVADAARAVGAPRVETAIDVEAALAHARALAGEDGIVIVAGSLYVAGAARAAVRH
ncbi:MAG TPA: Mur ligase family protein [Acidimicrobiales bacterium]|nr:Mur ligase family protein [Acidimicrobiales bacterium]